MIKASALFIVLVVSFVVGAITSAIVFATFYYRLEVSDLLIYRKLNSNINSVVASLKVMPEESIQDSIVWDLYAEGEDSVSYKVKPWGIFEVAQVAAFFQTKKLQKTFLFGYTLDKQSKAALSLSDSDRGLRVSGNTLIVGDCYLPQGVVKTSNVDGRFYQGPSKLIDGQIFKSSKESVELNKDLVHYLNQLLALNGDTYTLTDKDTSILYNSFANPPYIITYDSDNFQNLVGIKGNVILYSKKPLVLDKRLFLEDVVVIAPSVVVPENYAGSLQVIATDSIVLKENVRLLYPSALVLIKNKSTTPLAYVHLSKGAEVLGVVCAYSNFINEEQVIITLSKESVVHGQVYSNAYVNCQGMVKGGIIANKLLLKTAVSMNENSLLDATIDVSKRAPGFVGSKLLPVSNQRGIVKWL